MVTSRSIRRSHQKSRLGCSKCKARRIKCDEQRPSCENCIKYQTECDFQPKKNTLAPTLNSSGLNMDDLELLFNFTTLTYATLSESIPMRDFYRITVVQLGLNCEYVMRSVLSLSALHIANYRPNQRAHYHQIALAHYQVAAGEASRLLPSADDVELAQNLFIFSTLAFLISLALPQQNNGEPPIHKSGLPDWLFLLQGSMSILNLIPPDERNSGLLSPIVSHGAQVWALRENSSAVELPLIEALSDFTHGINERVDLDPNIKKIYCKAVDELQKSYVALYTGGAVLDRSFVFMWLFMQADDLLPLLRSPAPEVLCILAFFCVLLKKLDYHWCIKGWPDYLLGKILHLIQGPTPHCIRVVIEEIGYIV